MIEILLLLLIMLGLKKWAFPQYAEQVKWSPPPPQSGILHPRTSRLFQCFSSHPDRGVQTLISSTICGSSILLLLITQWGGGGGGIIQSAAGRGLEFNPSLIATQPFDSLKFPNKGNHPPRTLRSLPQRSSRLGGTLRAKTAATWNVKKNLNFEIKIWILS